MSKYKVTIEIDIPERCKDCRFRSDISCLMDYEYRYVDGVGAYRPYWCPLNDAEEVKDERGVD